MLKSIHPKALVRRDIRSQNHYNQSSHNNEISSKKILPAVLDNVCFQRTGKYLLNNISVSIPSNSITTVMGPNGSGKSLLLRLIHGLLKPTSGTITWAGLPLCQDVQKKQAMVFQTPVLLKRSVRANIKFALHLRGKNNLHELEKILHDTALKDQAEQDAGVLSGGEKQRLALARALCLKPKVLLLDEPTASLDPASTYEIEKIILQSYQCGVTIVLVTHDVSQARRIGDNIIFLHDGKVYEHAKSKAFFLNPCSKKAQDYLAGRIVL